MESLAQYLADNEGQTHTNTLRKKTLSCARTWFTSQHICYNTIHICQSGQKKSRFHLEALISISPLTFFLFKPTFFDSFLHFAFFLVRILQNCVTFFCFKLLVVFSIIFVLYQLNVSEYFFDRIYFEMLRCLLF